MNQNYDENNNNNKKFYLPQINDKSGEESKQSYESIMTGRKKSPVN